jgi:hypothetical protein
LKLADRHVFVLSNTALNVCSWIVSSKVHLNFDILSILTGVSLVVTGTESKFVSLGLPRFETCPMTSLFLSEHALIVDSWMVSSGPSVTGLSQVVTKQQSRNLFLLEVVRNLLTRFFRCVDPRRSILARSSGAQSLYRNFLFVIICPWKGIHFYDDST